jgi:hypothetical protein
MVGIVVNSLDVRMGTPFVRFEVSDMLMVDWSGIDRGNVSVDAGVSLVPLLRGVVRSIRCKETLLRLTFNVS